MDLSLVGINRTDLVRVNRDGVFLSEHFASLIGVTRKERDELLGIGKTSIQNVFDVERAKASMKRDRSGEFLIIPPYGAELDIIRSELGGSISRAMPNKYGGLVSALALGSEWFKDGFKTQTVSFEVRENGDVYIPDGGGITRIVPGEEKREGSQTWHAVGRMVDRYSHVVDVDGVIKLLTEGDPASN